jgi:2-polyprenyl-6-hydroxyphenyl methylase/3-demethylubiquinone-9 3-methyltransferase
VKEFYNRCPRWLQPAVVVAIGGPWMVQRALMKLFAALMNGLFSVLNGRRPRLFRSTRTVQHGDAQDRRMFQSQRARGMHWWYDLVDWIGGYPFEVAKPEAVLQHLRGHEFELTQMTTCGGNLGCNEFVFRRAGNA